MIEARRIWVLRLIAFPLIIPASLAVLGLVSIADRLREWIAGAPILLLLIYAWLVAMFGRTHTQIDAKSKMRTLFQRPHLLDLGRNRSESKYFAAVEISDGRWLNLMEPFLDAAAADAVVLQFSALWPQITVTRPRVGKSPRLDQAVPPNRRLEMIAKS